MANIVAQFNGTGIWKAGYTPDAGAFLRELRNNGYNPTSFDLILASPSADGRSGYGFRFTLNEKPTAKTKTVNDLRNQMYGYLNYYFDNLSLQVIGNTQPATVPIVQQVTQQGTPIVVNVPNNGVTQPPMKNSAASLLDGPKAPLILLGFVGIAIVLVIGQRK